MGTETQAGMASGLVTGELSGDGVKVAWRDRSGKVGRLGTIRFSLTKPKSLAPPQPVGHQGLGLD